MDKFNDNMGRLCVWLSVFAIGMGREGSIVLKLQCGIITLIAFILYLLIIKLIENVFVALGLIIAIIYFIPYIAGIYSYNAYLGFILPFFWFLFMLGFHNKRLHGYNISNWEIRKTYEQCHSHKFFF